MKISKSMQDAISAQINAEFQSAYMYLGMAASLEEQNFPGMASWMKKQAEEEIAHGMKFFDFVFSRQGNISLPGLKQAKTGWKSPLEVFEAAYSHEQKVTRLINGLHDLAQKEKDHATRAFLQWYIQEQVEEEQHANDIVEKIKMIGKSVSGLLYLDKELGKRMAE
ncbi:MAG: ferritin [DPANN group archaeon]|nr:ferritin [DPANN group archaeon]